MGIKNWFKKPDGKVSKTRVAGAGGGIITAASIGMAAFLSIADVKQSPMTAQFEGTVLANYIDAVGVETWCTGETQLGRLKAGYTLEYCQNLFNKRFAQYSKKLYACYSEEMRLFVTPGMHGTFTDLYYNSGARCNTGMMRHLAQGQPVAACNYTLEYRKAGGRDCSKDKGNPRGCYGVWERRVKLHSLCVEEAKQLERYYDTIH